jgi:Leucine-rich repeat (LRR) protein
MKKTRMLQLSCLLIGLTFCGGSDTPATINPVLEQEVERNILISLYQFTNGESWTKNDNWNNPQVHICDWHGIQCINPESSSRRNARRRLADADESRSVESIDLAENNMKGSVPISLLLLLPNIRSIRLNGNNVDYTKVAQQETEVLGQILDLPISVHSAIQHLDVSHTSVKDITRLFRTGSGNTVIEMPRLSTFYASQSQLRGTFPSFLFDMLTMERLALDHNSLTGSIPITLGQLHKLKYISLADNELTGKLPEETVGLKKLRYMLFESNRLTGTIPIALASVEYTPLLEQLDLSDQRDGSTPPGPSAGLSGTIPAFNTQKFLRRIDLGVNSLTGTIPSTLLAETEDFDDFDFIILSSNLLSGSVPSTVINNRVPIDGLFLDNNKITDLTNCPFAEYGCKSIMCPPGTYEPRSGRQEEDRRPCLSCPKNTMYWGQTVCKQEEGEENAPTPAPTPATPAPTRSPMSAPSTDSPTDVPLPTRAPTTTPTVGEPLVPVNEKAVLADLYVAAGGDGWLNSDGWSTPDNDDSFCDWHGVVCVSEDSKSVKFLNLDNNNLLGELPNSIYTLPNMRSLDLSQNDGLTVSFTDIGKARSLEALDLSKTIITSVDGILDAASRLQELHINDVGAFANKKFPTEFYQLTTLRQLSMDYNEASGSLPSDFGKLHKLVIFSASNNQLTGSIPSSIALLTDLATLRLSTNHLSGELPEEMQDMRSISLLDLSNQWSNGVDDDFATDGKPGLHGPLPAFANYSQLRRLDLGVNSFSGTVPDNFLQSVDPENLFEFADIGDNFLTGTVPAGVKQLPNLYMHDNFIDGVDQQVCDAVSTELQAFGCDAVLCKPGTYNQQGRQTSDDKPCIACTKVGGAKHFGSTDCFVEMVSPTPGPIDQPNGGNIPDSPERVALELIYTRCGGQGWAAKNNWMNKAVPICLWDGIRCDSESVVVSITLRSNNLEGVFPSLEVFENIPSLTSLVLDGNVVKFPFEGIDKADNLETLDLTHIELTDVVGVDTAPNLKNLYLASNNLKGNIPSEVIELASLHRLALAFNDLSGTVPNLTKLSNLEFLSLHDNDLTGSIPASLGQLSKLSFLLLQSNSFEGSIPTQLNFLGNLGFFSLAGQRGDEGKGLSGRIPSFATLTSLKKMDLSANQLTGTIPADFLDKVAEKAFEHLSLAQNRLTGEIPNILAKFPAEQYDFTDNEISTLGDGLCNQASVGVLEAFGCDAVLCPPGTWNNKGRQLNGSEKCDACAENKFFGTTSCDDGSGTSRPTLPPVSTTDLTYVEILSKLFDQTKGSSWKRSDHWKQSSISVCEWFGVHCAKAGTERIEHIVLSANNMLGTVPKEVFLLPYLKTLVLDSNEIAVDLSEIGSARLLEVLDISGTSIGDVTGIGAASQLRELHLKQNGLTGPFPAELFQLTSLEQLDFDFNSFSGPLGHGIGQLSDLKQLSGEKNMLSGVLPDQLRELTDLVTLRLGKNSFAGNVPADALNQMTSLAYIDLSSQDEHGGDGFSGELPTLDKLRRLTQIRMKHNSFSGTIPFNFLQQVNAEEFQYADVSSNSLTGTLPVSLAQIGSIYVQDNMISGVPREFCDETRGVEYTQFGCDAFLCKPGTYNHHGRQESKETGCNDCPEAPYFGAVNCDSGGNSQPAAGPTPPVIEKDVLVKLYQTCGGDNWDEADNWLSTGSICTWGGIKCVEGASKDTVEAIQLGANNLHGTPPTELYAMPSLKSLSLYSNPLKGVDFDGIQYASKMTELLLDATGISSVDGIEAAPSLQILNLRFNAFIGSLPSQLTELTSLNTLTMAYNALTGSLPSAIEEMTNLKALLLSHNTFSGNLHSVNFPSSLRRLDLSDNRLTGSIPESFLTLVSFNAELEVDLSSNQLTGSIPTDLTRFSLLDIYLKDNKLTELNDQLCSMSDWNEGDVGRYGCNGILCPTGHFSPNGRHSASGECQQCAPGRALHLGASNCDDTSSAFGIIHVMAALSIAVGGFLLILVC